MWSLKLLFDSLGQSMALGVCNTVNAPALNVLQTGSKHKRIGQNPVRHTLNTPQMRFEGFRLKPHTYVVERISFQLSLVVFLRCMYWKAL